MDSPQYKQPSSSSKAGIVIRINGCPKTDCGNLRPWKRRSFFILIIGCLVLSNLEFALHQISQLSGVLSSQTETESLENKGFNRSAYKEAVVERWNQSNMTSQPTNNTIRRKKEIKPEIFYSPGPIFFNVYVPETHSERVVSMVKQQLADKNEFDPNSTLFYTLISKKNASAIEDVFHTKCPKQCQLRERLTVGNEVDTLQALWEYCNSKQVPSSKYNDTLVSYIHDKGSFHKTRSNDWARELGTRSTLHVDCKMVSPETPEQLAEASWNLSAPKITLT
eukprot:scaffold69_cov89-Cylindrotheca_fusiformis.AAC.1